LRVWRSRGQRACQKNSHGYLKKIARRACDCGGARLGAIQARGLLSTREFAEHISAIVGISYDELFQIVRDGSDPATWAHWQIAMAYAKYLLPEFHAWCNEVVRAHMEQRNLPIEATRAAITLSAQDLTPPDVSRIPRTVGVADARSRPDRSTTRGLRGPPTLPSPSRRSSAFR
jgi:hypothetical protein